jgi:hypothetical protein
MKFDRQQMEQTLAGLGNRIFLMNNVHEDAPEIFETRWTLSYLRGPLTRNQIKLLMHTCKAEGESKTASQSGQETAPATVPVPAAKTGAGEVKKGKAVIRSEVYVRPVLPPKIPQFFISSRGTQPQESRLLYTPMLLGCGKVYFSDSKAGVDVEVPVSCLAEITEPAVAVDWQNAEGKLIRAWE